MKIIFENDFQQKIMSQRFEEPTALQSAADVREWRQQWTQQLKSWHSPYKSLIDCTNLQVGDDPAIAEELSRMGKFLTGFFLKNAAGFGLDVNASSLFFPIFPTVDEAAQAVGVRSPRQPQEAKDFRASIVLTNYFQQHVMELSFSQPTLIHEAAQLDILRSKIMNNLMQWHSKWSLLVDCSNLEFGPGMADGFSQIERALKGFFLKKILGYSPKGPKETYPFDVYRARHNAAGRLEAEGQFSGEEANCNSRKG